MSPYWATKWYSREEPYFPKDLKKKLNKVEASIYLKMFRIRKKKYAHCQVKFQLFILFPESQQTRKFQIPEVMTSLKSEKRLSQVKSE